MAEPQFAASRWDVPAMHVGKKAVFNRTHNLKLSKLA